jgi:ArsR family transcriptional regulator, virulence genes transcriptional regulator
MKSGLTLEAENAAQFLKLIANTNRLLILCTLQDGAANVGQLEQKLGVSQPALSQHLARMRQEGVLETKRQGQHIFYSVKDPRIAALMPLLSELFPAQ